VKRASGHAAARPSAAGQRCSAKPQRDSFSDRRRQLKERRLHATVIDKRQKREENVMTLKLALVCGAAWLALAGAARADCAKLPNHTQLHQALVASVKPAGGPSNGGFDLHMWATIVDRDGKVCAVTFSGGDRGDQFPGSRVISAQKAYTANAFSLNGFALSTANLFTAVQPGGSLFGLQGSNLMNPAVAFAGNAEDYGTERDPMVGEHLGGVIVFGGGLALYEKTGVVGAVGVSGDSACADHNIAWRVRKALALGNVPAGVSPNKDDGIVYDIAAGASKSGWGHPTCGGKEPDVAKDIGAGVGP
jgi:uncharacterized protein GlcG (DUF336 family)